MLIVENLQKTYKGSKNPALKNITMTAEQGEFIAILGKSGAGKSTFIRCINRLVDADHGVITWENKNVLTLKGIELRQYRSKIGMIFQSFYLIERLNALTNVLTGKLGSIPSWRANFLNFTNDEKDQAFHELARVNMEESANKRVTQLSGGQRQRVAIARALMQKPKLILADEPVASLDPLTAKTVMNLLKMINEEDQITMLINLHDVALAKEFAGRIIGISDGRIVFDGPPEELTDEKLNEIYL